MTTHHNFDWLKLISEKVVAMRKDMPSERHASGFFFAFFMCANLYDAGPLETHVTKLVLLAFGVKTGCRLLLCLFWEAADINAVHSGVQAHEAIARFESRQKQVSTLVNWATQLGKCSFKYGRLPRLESNWCSINHLLHQWNGC